MAEIYGAQVSKETISRITDRVMEGRAAWQSPPVDRVYPVIFIDAVRGAVSRRLPARLP